MQEPVLTKEEYINIIRRFTPCSKEFVLLEEDTYLSNDRKYKINRRKFRHAIFKNVEIEKTKTECLYPYMVHEDNKMIEKRKLWEPFGKGSIKGTVQDETFMEYNPKLLFNSGNRKVLRKYIDKRKRKQHEEDIKFYEDGEEEDYNYQVYKDYKTLLDVEKKFNKVNDILNRDFVEESIKRNKTNKENINNIVIQKEDDSTYIPPHLRERHTSRQNNNNENQGNTNNNSYSNSGNDGNNQGVQNRNKDYDYKSLKLSNYPDYVTKDEINDVINSIIPRHRFKINFLYHRDSGRLKNFCFVKFNHEEKAKEALELINGYRFENLVLSCEYSINRK